MSSHAARTVGVLLAPFVVAVLLGNLGQDGPAYALYALGLLMLVAYAAVRFVRWAWR